MTEAEIQTAVDAVAGVTWRASIPAHAAPGDAWAERVDVDVAGRPYWVPAVLLVSSAVPGAVTYRDAVIAALQAAFPGDAAVATPADVLSIRHVDPAGSFQAWRIQMTGGVVAR